MTLLDAVRIARRFWILIAACVLVGAGAGAAYAALQPRLYVASSEAYVQVTGSSRSVSEASVGNTVASAKAATYAPLTQSGMVAATVIEDLGLDLSPGQVADMVTYAVDPDSPRIQVFVTSTSPQRAKDIADAVVEATATAASFVENGGRADGSSVVTLLPVTSAVVPSEPVSPNVPKLVGVGLLGGAVLAYLLVLARLRLDTRIRRPDDIAAVTDRGLIGTIPRSRDLRQRLTSSTLMTGAVGEALRHLRTNLVFADPDRAPRSIVVTSPQPGEGKSTVSSLLARSLALRGETVVLVDGDLRRPKVAALFGIDSGLGLTQVLSGAVPLAEALVETDTPGLRVLPAGRIPHNPSEILGSDRMRQLLDHLGRTGLVVVDAPPTLPVTDSLILAQRVDGVIVVTYMGRTRKEQLRRTVELADGVNARVLGVVLNGIPQGRAAGVYGYENYGYETTSRWRRRSPAQDDETALEIPVVPAVRPGAERPAAAVDAWVDLDPQLPSDPAVDPAVDTDAPADAAEPARHDRGAEPLGR